MILLNFTVALCNGIRSVAVNLLGTELEKISSWILEILQITEKSPQYIVNVCQILYLLCAFGRSIENSWLNHNYVLKSLESDTKNGNRTMLSKMVPNVFKKGNAKEKPFTSRDIPMHTLKLICGIIIALVLETTIPYIVFQAYSEDQCDLFMDKATYFARFFSFSKYSAFLLANTASSIYWLWASCIYVSSDTPYSHIAVPLVYLIKALLFFIIRRVFRGCWNPDASVLGYYVHSYLSPYTSYPCVLFSFGILAFIAGVIGTPAPSLINRVKIPPVFIVVVLAFLYFSGIATINFMPRLLFETLRSDMASSGSYILALYFFPFTYTGNLFSFTFCMLTFLMFMEIGARSASSSFLVPLDSWMDLFVSLFNYFLHVFSSLGCIERYPISLFIIGFYVLKTYLPISYPSPAPNHVKRSSMLPGFRRFLKLKAE